MMTDLDTPRTDGAPWIQPSSLHETVPDCDERYVPISFARQLERELAESQAQYNILVSGRPKRLVEGSA